MLKTMFHSGGDKQEVVRSKFSALARANDFTGAADHHVAFVAAMRCLRIVFSRGVQFYDQGAVLEERDGTFLLRLRQALLRFFGCDCPWAHAHFHGPTFALPRNVAFSLTSRPAASTSPRSMQ